MPFQFQCTNCGQPVGAHEQQVGGVTACPSCGAQQSVPAPQQPMAQPQQQYGAQPQQQYGAQPQQQYGSQPQQQYGSQPQQQYGLQPQYDPNAAQYYVEEPQKETIGGRIVGALIIIGFLLLVNVFTYFGCGMIVY